ncbi:MAG: hydrogenase accessory protein HypB [bacterium F082]|nr:MAG: hydrogenase accessory protein HypB [bacterium F082]KWW31823.1 MAG: hydrogenase accessory protein HypB [bacterium P201]
MPSLGMRLITQLCWDDAFFPYFCSIINRIHIPMDEIKVIEIKKNVFEDNDKDAEDLRKELKDKGVFLLNLMSAPGSGKTTTLIQTLNRIKNKVRVAVMEADIDSDVDAVKIVEATGVPSIQLHTGGMCHLDAEMTRQGLDNVGLKDVDLVVLENVGNLVCPAEFDTGAVRNAMILSVPEGDDKPLKYPLMFTVCDLVLINKTDVMPYFDFDLERCKSYIHQRNPKAQVIPICAKTGEGVDAFVQWLLAEVNAWKNN